MCMYHKNWWNNKSRCWRFRFSHSVYNLIEYIWNYSETIGNLWFSSKDDENSFNVHIIDDNNFKSLNIRLNY